ncbi:Major Facilitator Superfamily protein [Saccharopolyspora kobensis]|uniref:Major Facilitator Superfamily protein n=1 Tax=Saccharopolyspora kobensis TaxID=146035 RepID=A0A1H6DBZ9_9PSEU|nr:MFS transporter [Saccharopolyspora kobensis]SEG82841.1 Major Facilitator Superfamily protein [Saccharopolyspora kobensis]SFE26641.1 Major Facilitator Superfamily protein [Saccharopolyspora kobensis]
MSQSASLADYRTALTAPGARGPVITSLLGRLPIAMVGLALMLYVQRETGSFAAAGLVSAGALIGVACGSVAQGRIMDRVGPTKPLYVMSAVFAALVTVEVLVIEAHAPVALMTGLAFLVGLSEPMVGPASRALWSQLLPPGPARNAAYSYEAISMETFFILGPGLAGLMVAMPWPGTGVVVGAACMVLGSVGFASTRAARAQRPERKQGGTSLLGAIASPGMRTVALAALGFGTLIGFIEVGVPAAAVEAGYPTAGGLLLSVLSISSVIVGVLYGLRPWPRPMHLRLPALLFGFAGLLALLALPSSLWGLCIALLVVGSLITPQSTAHSMAIEIAAPEGTATEAFGWVVTSVTLGAAIGQSVSGQLVELSGPAASFLAASAVGIAVAAVLWLRRRTLLTTTRNDVSLAGV